MLTQASTTPNPLILPASVLCVCSEELQQLSPELRAYLEELEAHGSGHGSWVHSHIAERLATTTSQDAGSE